jgi:hypothetical protein
MPDKITTKKRLQIERQQMPERDSADRATNFDEVNLGFTEQLALLEADRCLQCKDPRCVRGCPVGVNIPKFIDLLAHGNIAGAAQSLLCDNALPAVTGRVCPQETQCEADCVRGGKGLPVGIGYLERYVADWARLRKHQPPASKAASTGKRVAVVGSGPSGLTAAGELVRLGHDLTAVETLFRARGEDVAAILVEPVPGNMAVVPPVSGFLQGLRAVTRRYGALLVFDEVMTGWRVHPRGAQVLYGIEPDLTCLGKVVGGGLPAALYGGRRDLMERVAPAGPVYQAGTLSGNPLAMAAGLATLDLLARPGMWERAEAFAGGVAEAIERRAREAGVPVTVQRVGTMLTPFFTEQPVRDFAAARRTDRAGYNAFFHALLEAGVYLPPSAFEAAFTSAVHGEAELAAFEAALTSAWRR